MSLPDDFISTLTFIHQRDILAMIKDRGMPRGGGAIELHNEIRPVDLFCYLGARFGPPNGFQNLLRSDDSDNFIHWEWTLRHAAGIVSFQGMSFRTEVWVHGQVELDSDDGARLVSQLKADFAPHGKEMGAVRKQLEPWTEFINPYQRIRRALSSLLGEFDDLKLDPVADRIDNPWESDNAALNVRWADTGVRYRKGLSLCFGIRSMLPMLAESYVNLVLFALMRPELKDDDRLRENAVRQPIDIRIKSLSMTCRGFARQPDYSSDACRAYHRMVNERNDLLHGNVVVEKLKFNEVFFLQTVPIFREYRSIWQRSLDIEMQAVGLLGVRDELAIVDSLVAYLESCMEEKTSQEMRLIASRYELGLNTATGRMGILFSDRLMDGRLGPARPGKTPSHPSPDGGLS